MVALNPSDLLRREVTARGKTRGLCRGRPQRRAGLDTCR